MKYFVSGIITVAVLATCINSASATGNNGNHKKKPQVQAQGQIQGQIAKGGQGGAGGHGGKGGTAYGGNGGKGVGIGVGGNAKAKVKNSGNSHNKNINVSKGGSAKQGQLQGQKQKQGIKNSGNSKNTNIAKGGKGGTAHSYSGASTYTKVKNNVSNGSESQSSSGGNTMKNGSKSGAYAGGSESEAYTGDNSVNIEGDDVYTEGDDYDFPSNSVPMSIGGVCTDSAAAQGMNGGISISRANPVCEKLKMHQVYMKLGMKKEAMKSLKDAEALSDVRAFFRGTLTVLTLGIL